VAKYVKKIKINMGYAKNNSSKLKNMFYGLIFLYILLNFAASAS